MTLDNSGPVIALDTTSSTCRAVFAEIRATKAKLCVPRYTPTEMLTSGLIYGTFCYVLFHFIPIC